MNLFLTSLVLAVDLQIAKTDVYDLISTFGDTSSIQFRMDCVSDSTETSKTSEALKIVDAVFHQSNDPIVFQFTQVNEECETGYTKHPVMLIRPEEMGFSSMCDELILNPDGSYTFDCDIESMPR